MNRRKKRANKNPDLRLGNFFHRRQERGRSGLPLMSVTLNDGIVERRTLDRKTDSGLLPKQHLLVRKGDIAYNMMRMWQGASGLVRHDGLVSPSYVVVTPNSGINSKFAAYWFKSPAMIHKFWAYSYGLAKDRLRLYFDDFAKIPAIPPPEPEQARIAAILESWEKAIEQVESLIQAKRKERKALTQSLVSGKRRLPGKVTKWRRLEFAEIASRSEERQDTSKAPSQLPCVELEHIASGDGRLLGPLGSSNQQGMKSVFHSGAVLFGKLRPNLRKFLLCTSDGLCSTEIWVLNPNKTICTSKFLFRLVQTHRFISAACVSYGSKMPRADWDWVSEQPFEVPPVPEQERITAVLDTLDFQIEVLFRYSASLRTQMQGLVQKLLDMREMAP